MKKFLSMFLMMFMVMACATVPKLTKEEIRAITTITYNSSYEKVFNATKTVFLDSGVVISSLNKTDGIITGATEERKSDDAEKVIFGSDSYKTYVYSAVFNKISDNKVELRLLISDQVRTTESLGILDVLGGTIYKPEKTTAARLKPTYDKKMYDYIFNKIQQELYR
ncbi:hypothetical protein [Oceanivirga salmonicida]|uniref:hypothetical protein n=1 Tax=Oceanivirga salmonicida TaxID=1769291 RepID=UPI00082A3DC4|nr:hypothetical protein [Oceanivirga salmonicida]